WHDPGGLQGNRKHSRLEWRHNRELRACRCGHNRNRRSIDIRVGQETQMRNIIFAINITLDGCCDHTRQVADDETHEYFTDLLREVDLLVFGRITYQLMVPFWPEVAKS